MRSRLNASGWMAALLAAAGLGVPAVGAAQDHDDAAPATAEASSPAPAAPLTPGETTAVECPDQPGYVMPSTGFVFTLPPPADAAQDEQCEPAGPPPPVRPPAPSLFRMIALPVGEIAQLQKWEDARSGDMIAQSGSWDELLSEARRLPGADPLMMVNNWVNWRLHYRNDARGDEWSAAPATLRRGYGDCEDFVLAKMALLRALGTPSDDMYMVLLRDRRQIEHAVLAVKRDGRMVILDNRTDMILPAEKIRDYTPIVSYSGPFAWAYGSPVTRTATRLSLP